MYRFIIGPLIVGILAFLSIYFLLPVFISESDTVAVVARTALGLSNAYFDNMPPAIASYINNLNLARAALTVALSLTVVIQLLAIIGSVFVSITRLIIAFLQREKKEAPKDLPPIEMDSGFESSGDGKDVLGRGLDSIDRE